MGTWNIKIVWVFWHDVSSRIRNCMHMFMRVFTNDETFSVLIMHSVFIQLSFHTLRNEMNRHKLISWSVWYVFLGLKYLLKNIFYKASLHLNAISVSSTDREGPTELKEFDMFCRNKQKPEESVGPLSTPFCVSREQLQQFITTILCLPRPQKAQGPIAVKFNVAIRHKSSFTRPDEQVAILRASLLFWRWYK